MVRICRRISSVDELKGEHMGHFIVLMIWGICGLLLPKKTKQRLMEEEGEQWLREHGEL